MMTVASCRVLSRSRSGKTTVTPTIEYGAGPLSAARSTYTLLHADSTKRNAVANTNLEPDMADLHLLERLLSALRCPHANTVRPEPFGGAQDRLRREAPKSKGYGNVSTSLATRATLDAN